MAVRYGDIKEGHYWVRDNLMKNLSIVSVVGFSNDFGKLKVWNYCWGHSQSLNEAWSNNEFIARIEPPEGV